MKKAEQKQRGLFNIMKESVKLGLILILLLLGNLWSCNSDEVPSNFMERKDVNANLVQRSEKILKYQESNDYTFDIFVKDIEGIKVAFAVATKTGEVYAFIFNHDGELTHTIKKEIKQNGNGYTSIYYFMNDLFIGGYLVNSSHNLISMINFYKGRESLITKNGVENSCIGERYKQIMEAIDADGDSRMICDFLLSGSICKAEALAAATIKCLIEEL